MGRQVRRRFATWRRRGVANPGDRPVDSGDVREDHSQARPRCTVKILTASDPLSADCTPPPRRRLLVRAVAQRVEELLENPAGGVESHRVDRARPVILDLCNPISGVVQGSTTATGWEDELGATIARVRPALEVAKLFEFGDEL